VIDCIEERGTRPHPNSYLLDEHTGSYIPSLITDGRFHRYHFVHRGDAEHSDGEFAAIGRLILQAIGEGGMWLQAWIAQQAGARKYHLLQLEKRRLKDGWTVRREADVVMTSVELETFSESSLWPKDYQWSDGGVCAIFGHTQFDEMKDSQLASVTIQSMAYTGKMVPSTWFFEWLSVNDASVLYAVTDIHDRRIVIFHGVHRLPIHLWLNKGLVHSIESCDYNF
jgi:hypothetical protein